VLFGISTIVYQARDVCREVKWRKVDSSRRGWGVPTNISLLTDSVLFLLKMFIDKSALYVN
jgi:hypothetical protein